MTEEITHWITNLKPETYIAFFAVGVSFYAIKKQSNDKQDAIKREKLEVLLAKLHSAMTPFQANLNIIMVKKTAREELNPIGPDYPSEKFWIEQNDNILEMMRINDVYSPFDIWIQIDQIARELMYLHYYSKTKDESYISEMKDERFSSRAEFVRKLRPAIIELRDHIRTSVNNVWWASLIKRVALITSKRYWRNRKIMFKNVLDQTEFPDLDR